MRSRRRIGAGALLLALAVAAAYAPILIRPDLTWDDYKFVEANPRLDGSAGLRALWTAPGSGTAAGGAPPGVEMLWIPLLYTTLWIEAAITGGPSARGLHTTNLILHLANALLAWRLLARLRLPGAWLAATAWALHPGIAEAAGLVMGRKDMLPATLMLTACLLWLRRGTEAAATPPTAGTAALGAAAMLCKPTAVILPGLLALVHLLDGRRPDRSTLARLAALQALLGAIGLAQWHVLRDLSVAAVHDLSAVERLLLAGRAAWVHLGATLAPWIPPLQLRTWSITADDPLAWASLAGWAAAAGWIVHRLRRRSNHRAGPTLPAAAAAALAWMLICLGPSLGLIDHPSLHMSLAWSHHRYLASLGPWALVAGLAATGLRRIRPAPRTAAQAAAAGLLRGGVAATLLGSAVATAGAAALITDEPGWMAHWSEGMPGSGWIRSRHVAALLRSARAEEAVAAARAHVRRHPGSLAALRDTAAALAAAGRTLGAASAYERLITRLEAEGIPPRPCTAPRSLDGPAPFARSDAYAAWWSYSLLLDRLGRTAEAGTARLRRNAITPARGEVWVFHLERPHVVAPPPGAAPPACTPSRDGG